MQGSNEVGYFRARPSAELCEQLHVLVDFLEYHHAVVIQATLYENCYRHQHQGEARTDQGKLQEGSSRVCTEAQKAQTVVSYPCQSGLVGSLVQVYFQCPND